MKKLLDKPEDDDQLEAFMFRPLSYLKICCCEIWKYFMGDEEFTINHDESKKYDIFSDRKDHEADSKNNVQIFKDYPNGAPIQV